MSVQLLLNNYVVMPYMDKSKFIRENHLSNTLEDDFEVIENIKTLI